MARFSYEGVGLGPDQQNWKGFSGRSRSGHSFRAHAVTWGVLGVLLIPTVLLVAFVPIAAVIYGSLVFVTATLGVSKTRYPLPFHLIGLVGVGGFIAVNETWAAGKLLVGLLILGPVWINGPRVVAGLLNSERTVGESLGVLWRETVSPRLPAPTHRRVSARKEHR